MVATLSCRLLSLYSSTAQILHQSESQIPDFLLLCDQISCDFNHLHAWWNWTVAALLLLRLNEPLTIHFNVDVGDGIVSSGSAKLELNILNKLLYLYYIIIFNELHPCEFSESSVFNNPPLWDIETDISSHASSRAGEEFAHSGVAKPIHFLLLIFFSLRKREKRLGNYRPKAEPIWSVFEHLYVSALWGVSEIITISTTIAWLGKDKK